LFQLFIVIKYAFKNEIKCEIFFFKNLTNDKYGLLKGQIGPYFQKSFWNEFFCFSQNIVFNEHVFKKIILAFTCMDFMSCKKILPSGIHHDKWHQWLLI
jgi:hypothetical protein